MIKITKYVANDGQVFDSKAECMKYEENSIAKEMVKYGLKIWKQDGTRYVPVLANFSGLLEAKLISVPSSEARSFLKQISRDAGIEEIPHAVGDWYYDEECEKWCDYSHYHDAMEAFKFMKEHK